MYNLVCFRKETRQKLDKSQFAPIVDRAVKNSRRGVEQLGSSLGS